MPKSPAPIIGAQSHPLTGPIAQDLPADTARRLCRQFDAGAITFGDVMDAVKRERATREERLLRLICEEREYLRLLWREAVPALPEFDALAAALDRLPEFWPIYAETLALRLSTEHAGGLP